MRPWLTAACLTAAWLSTAGAQADPWPRYEIMVWQPQPAAAWPALRKLGITAGKITGERGAVTPGVFQDRLAPLTATATPFYVENIATDFYANYHRYTPGKPANWRFEALRQAYRANPLDPALWLRDPGLEDPAWRARIAERLRAHVRELGGLHPLYYNLGDETGIADLAANWDFDFSASALAAFRAWLRGQYRTLAALNAEWNSHYATWDEVLPQTTDAALARGDADYAAWSDFKAWMDISYANAVRMGTDTLHAADPAAQAGLEGGQAPGWGGYDYGVLPRAVDVMELYDIGDSLDIAHALNPQLTILTTNFDTGAPAIRALWHDVLAGARGVVLWEEGAGLADAAGHPGPRGQGLAASFHALRNGPGARLLAASPARAPVAILYSQPSFRLSWLLDRRSEKTGWVQRDSGWEDEHDNPWRAATTSANAVLLHQGLPPDFITDTDVAAGGLRHAAARMLILPHAVALSDQALAEIAAFAARGGVVVADVPPGQFDGHGGTRAPAPKLALRLTGAFTPSSLAAPLRAAGIAPDFALTGPAGPVTDTRTRRWYEAPATGPRARPGGITLLALQRDVPAGGLTVPAEPATLTLRAPAQLTDLMSGHTLGQGRRFRLLLDATTPCLLAIAPLPSPAVHAAPQ